jgi:hypothetical protein
MLIRNIVEALNLKEDLLRGIYGYSESYSTSLIPLADVARFASSVFTI